MASVHSSTMVPLNDEYDPADPFTWNLAQLEHELCDNPQPGWAAVAKRAQLPSEVLRTILRDNMVDGQSLMEELLTADGISKELGITAFGMKRALLRILDFFRKTSTRYSAVRQREVDDQNAEMYGRRMSLLNGGFASPQITTSIYSGLRQSPTFGVPASTSVERVHQPGFPTSENNAVTVHSPTLQRQDFKKPVRSVEPVFEDAVERSPLIPPQANWTQPTAVVNTIEDRQAIPLNPVKAKKRVAPTFVSYIDDSRAKAREEHHLETQRDARQPSPVGSTQTDDSEAPDSDFILSPQAASSTYKEMLARGVKRKLSYMSRGSQQAPGRHGARHPTSRRRLSAVDLGLDDADEADDADLDTQFDYLLLKYPPLAEDRDVLPQLGDSDDEEYGVDDETLDEMEAEREEKRQVFGYLTEEQIGLAIDEAVEEIKAVWREKTFVKVQLKGYRIWTKAAKEGRRWLHSQNHQLWIRNLTKRIDKLRKAIVEMKHTWHKASEVKQQCQCLEESVSQREEYQYYVDILDMQKTPERPDVAAVQRARKIERATLPEGEEVLESEDDSDLLQEFVRDDSSDAESIAHDEPDPGVDEILQTRIGRRQELEQLLVQTHIPALALSDPTTPKTPEQQPATSEANSRDASSNTSNEEHSDSEPIITPSAKRMMGGKARAEALSQDTHRHAETNVMDIDTEDDGYKQDSDLDQPALPKTQYRSRGKTISEAIELLSSSPSAAEQTEGDTPSAFEIRTPDLNPIDQTPKSKPKLKLTFPASRRSSDQTSSPIIKLSQPSDPSGLPNLEDVENMRSLDWSDIADAADHRRALAKAVYDLSWENAEPLYSHVDHLALSQEKEQDVLKQGLITLNSEDAAIQAFRNKKARLASTMALLFLSYVHHTDYVNDFPIAQADIDEAYTDLGAGSRGFYACLRIALESYRRYQEALDPSTPPKKKKKKRKKTARTEEDEQSELDDDSDLLMQDADEQSDASNEPASSHKKRKYKVEESQEAKSQQLNDQLRVAENERRRMAVEKKMQSMKATSGDPSKYSINFDETRLVYLDPHIGSRVKPHQVNGIQFMWREIVDDAKQRGCLLAHTMGLGKTMQVISLLVTMAQCNHSPDPRIRELIPAKHRQMTVLILCPPSLLDNWHEELILWTPPGSPLGEIRKITPSFTLSQRAGQIHAWVQEGGVLLIGYEMFRNLLDKQKSKLEESMANQLEEDLVNGPNIIVADEAHKMKNAKAKITQVASRFGSLSRIALTGSPLNNHLEEYHAMVDWIAPGYLGNLVQFKDKYSEPIGRGLYADSTPGERRLSLKKLHVLNRDLDPKICRADISAIENDMPSKTEFFITIPLTELQIHAYTIFVNYLLDENRGRRTSNTKLWNWLAVLSLLCNHPACFINILERRKEKEALSVVPQHQGLAETDDPGQTLPVDVSLADTGLSAEVMEKAIKVFQEEHDNGTLDLPRLSNRSLIVSRIIAESMAIGDKVLIFSHSIPTLDYLEDLLEHLDCQYSRIDGATSMSDRQQATKRFNNRDNASQVFLISMRAGGLGLNLQGANRVIVYDFSWNPSWEEQAIGRAYRLGQKKPVFVYRFRAGGTFEEVVYNKAVFKTQLFQRVVDKKNPMRHASKNPADYLFLPRAIEERGYGDCPRKDPKVLDRILARENPIVNIELTETFQKEDDESLTAEEIKEAEEEYAEQQLERDDPVAFQRKQAEKQLKEQLAEQLRRQANKHLMTNGSHAHPQHSYPGVFPRGRPATNLTPRAALQTRPNLAQYGYPPVPGSTLLAQATATPTIRPTWPSNPNLASPLAQSTPQQPTALIYRPTLDHALPADRVAAPPPPPPASIPPVHPPPPQLDGLADVSPLRRREEPRTPSKDVEMTDENRGSKRKAKQDNCSPQ